MKITIETKDVIVSADLKHDDLTINEVVEQIKALLKGVGYGEELINEYIKTDD